MVWFSRFFRGDMFFIHGFDGTCRHERPHANEFKIQPPGVLRHFGYFHPYGGPLKDHFNKHIFQYPFPTLLAHCDSRAHTTTRCLSGCATAVFVLKTPHNSLILLTFCDWPWHAFYSAWWPCGLWLQQRWMIALKAHVVDAVVNNASCAERIPIRFLLVWQIAPWPWAEQDVFHQPFLKHAILRYIINVVQTLLPCVATSCWIDLTDAGIMHTFRYICFLNMGICMYLYIIYIYIYAMHPRFWWCYYCFRGALIAGFARKPHECLNEKGLISLKLGLLQGWPRSIL